MYVGVGSRDCPKGLYGEGYEQRRDCPNNNYILPDRVVLYD